jgi:hypothetical protein
MDVNDQYTSTLLPDVFRVYLYVFAQSLAYIAYLRGVVEFL